MVGHWFHWLSDFATTWLPLAFFGILILTAWLLTLPAAALVSGLLYYPVNWIF